MTKEDIKNMDIKQLMDEYVGENATPERRARAIEFANYLEQQADVKAALLLLKNKNEHELGIAPEQIKARRRRYATAAIVTGLLIGTTTFYVNRQPSQIASTTHGKATEIFVANPKAQLKLKNGQTIFLDASANGQVFRDKSIVIQYTGQGSAAYSGTGTSMAYNPDAIDEITVPKGGKYTLRLTDGTTVTLNSLTKLKFNPYFNGPLRTVYLQGEAFFDVAKNPSRPFQIIGPTQSIKVLGTSFSVSNYEQEPVITTVLTGRVKMTTQDTSKPQDVIINPNQQAVYISGKIISVSDVNALKLTSWKDDRYELTGEPLSQALIKLGRWFDVQVDTTQVKDNKPVYASFKKTKSLAEVLANISENTNLKLELDGDRIIVK